MVAAYVKKHPEFDDVVDAAERVSDRGPISSVSDDDSTRRAGTPSAFFVPDGDAFVPAPIARGPWGQTISGNYLGGLLGHVLERDAGDPDLQPAD